MKNKSIQRHKKFKYNKKSIRKGNTKRHTKRNTKRNTKRYTKKHHQKGGDLQITISYSNIANVPYDANITPQINELLLSEKDNHLPPFLQLQNASPDTLYLITMTDPDAPPGDYTHWIATMQNGKILNTITKYNHPTPPEGSGTHRYITNVYEINNQQKEKIINDLQNQIGQNQELSRVEITIQLNNIIKSNKLTPLATHQFLVNPV